MCIEGVATVKLVAQRLMTGLYAITACFGAMAQTTVSESRSISIVREATGISQMPRFEPIVTANSTLPSGVFNASMMFLAEQLDRNVAADMRQRPTVITNIATLNALNETSALGRLISEHVMHELQVRSWAVMDIRLAKEIMITENGEFTLSRDAKKLRDNMPALNVITGTYTATSDGILVSVRAVDLSSGRVLSTAQTRLARDKFTLGLMEKPQPIPAAALAR